MKVAIVCLCNMNRSMEAHDLLRHCEEDVRSYGAGNEIFLRGPSPDSNNTYAFGVTYKQIYEDLCEKNRELYEKWGFLTTLQRNMKVKAAPERFQDANTVFDVVITCSRRIFGLVLDFLNTKKEEKGTTVQVVNLEVGDSYEGAEFGAFQIAELVTQMTETRDIHADIDEIIYNFRQQSQTQVQHVTKKY